MQVQISCVWLDVATGIIEQLYGITILEPSFVLVIRVNNSLVKSNFDIYFYIQVETASAEKK